MYKPIHAEIFVCLSLEKNLAPPPPKKKEKSDHKTVTLNPHRIFIFKPLSLQVIVDDLDQSITYKFPCSRWLATDEDDGQIYRDLLVGKGAVDINKGKVWSFLSSSFAIGRLRSPGSLNTNFIYLHLLCIRLK